MPEVNMPKLSDTMEEGTIVEWKKKTGDAVKSGDVLAEVESDKATFDLEAESDGVLSILVEQGVPAKIGAPIARIGDGSAAPAQEKAKAPAGAARPNLNDGGQRPRLGRPDRTSRSSIPRACRRPSRSGWPSLNPPSPSSP